MKLQKVVPSLLAKNPFSQDEGFNPLSKALPNEIWMLIFEKLCMNGPHELKSASLVCRKWCAICDIQTLEWVKLFYFQSLITSNSSCWPWIRSQFNLLKPFLGRLKSSETVFFEQVSSMRSTFIHLCKQGIHADRHALLNLLFLINKIYKKIYQQLLQAPELPLILKFTESHLLFLDMLLKTLSEEQQKTLLMSHRGGRSCRFFPQILNQHFVRIQLEIKKREVESLPQKAQAIYLKKRRSFMPAAAIIGSKFNQSYDSVKKLTLHEIERGCEYNIHHILSFLQAEEMEDFPLCAPLAALHRDIIIQIEKIPRRKASKHFSKTSYGIEIYWHLAFETCTSIIKLQLAGQPEGTIMIGLYGINTNSRWETVATTCSLIPTCTVFYPSEKGLVIDPVYASQGIELLFPIPEPANINSFFKFINFLLEARSNSILGAQLATILESGNFALPDITQYPEVCTKTLCFNEFFLKNKQISLKVAAYTLLGLTCSKYNLSDYRMKYGSIILDYTKNSLNERLKPLAKTLKPLISLKDMSIFLLLIGLQNQSEEARDLVKMLLEDPRMAAKLPKCLKIFKQALSLLGNMASVKHI